MAQTCALTNAPIYATHSAKKLRQINGVAHAIALCCQCAAAAQILIFRTRAVEARP